MFKKIWLKIVDIVHSFYFLSSSLVDKGYLYRIVGLIFLGMMSRLLPHPPNFTAMNAIALFGLCSLGNLGLSLFTVFITMFLSDLVFGFYPGMGFVYLSLGMIVLMGYGVKSNRSLTRNAFFLTLSPFLFFIITNFGVWFVGSMYPKTILGLELCYLAGVPFLLNNLMSTLLYGGLLFGSLALAERDTSAMKIKTGIT